MSLIKLNNNGVKNITSVGSVGTGELKFISKQTASSSASISFTSGIDSTYKEYIFYFVNMHPATDQEYFTVNFRDGDTNYDATKTSTVFQSYHAEDGSASGIAYEDGHDLAQSTSAQRLSNRVSSDNDASCSGYLHLFNPSSTTFVKHFIARVQGYYGGTYSIEHYTAGYCNVTSAIDAVQFAMSSGNIDSGEILLYGVN